MDCIDQPNSICHVQPIQMYPLPSSDCPHNLPFYLLMGETQCHSGTSVDGLIVITNYRLFLQIGACHYHIPLGLIEIVEQRELFYLQIGCKDARTYRCTFGNNENCLEWYDRIQKAAEPPRQLEQLFAFYHFVWSKEKAYEEVALRMNIQKQYTFDKDMFERERMRMDFGYSWRISSININYKLCPTYPPYLMVPSCINDETLESVAKFRSSKRIPAVVWRHTRNGAVIARCSQPEVGWLGWRSAEDEDLIKAISEACNFEVEESKDSNLSHSPGSLHSDDALQITNDVSSEGKKVLIMDARSYTTAVANRARGGGCECPEYYPNCEIQFMNLANIHSIRKSFHALRQLCTSSAELPNWFSLLEGTKWLQHMSGLLKASVTLLTAVERDARPVLVHCSDGWDRTPQIVALSELLLDPYYRTIEGFRTLIEREWLAFGHKFADRCGHSSGSEDQNERCPVFLQWLDCVHQLLVQFPCDFEFTQTYLVKLAQHTYSNLFGTFLCNTLQERSKIVFGKTFSVWEFLNTSCFKNHLYNPASGRKVLWPQCNVRDLQLWTEVYLGSMEANSTQEGISGACPGPPEDSPYHNMTKTRSYGDLLNAGDNTAAFYRRSSDPNINCDKPLSLSQEKSSNGCETNGTDSYSTNGSDADDCNTDCMFNNAKSTAGDKKQDAAAITDEIDGLDLGQDDGSGCRRGDNKPSSNDNHVICEKTEANDCDDGGSDRISSEVKSVLNGDKCDDACSESSLAEEKSESKSENTVCEMGMPIKSEKSVETSTETLVSEHILSGSSPREINGFEKVQSPTMCDESDGCQVCAKNMKFGQGTNGHCSAEASRYSTPKIYSRTSSSNGWTNPLYQKQPPYSHQPSLGVDGLVPLKSPVQERLDQIIEEQKRREDLLQKELQTYRQARLKLVCHKCNAIESERQDDNSDCELESSSDGGSSEAPNSGSSPSKSNSSSGRHRNSVAESLGSMGEGQASAVESLRSDMSWEAVEDSVLENHTQTLWVPDHAVTSCTACNIEFWMGRRKHHCRKCGKIFCADCAFNSTPLPSEQLFNPVRVCTSCYSKLRLPEDNILLLDDKCKNGACSQAAATTATQIAASSN